METINVLQEHSYPVIRNVNILKLNAKTIAMEVLTRYPNKNIWLAGIGSSGAMVMTSIVCENSYFTPILLKKENENTHRCSRETIKLPVSKDDDLIVIVDDFISSGSTFRTIVNHNGLRAYIEFVKVVAIQDFAKSFKGKVKELLPNLELIIC